MNRYRKYLITGMAVLSAVFASAQDGRTPIYLDTSYSFEERATDLVSRLTLEEKQSLLGNNMAAVPRLGGRGGFQMPQAAPLKVAFEEFTIVNRGQK